jgi:formylglycine-generating enzyme required for sulfatase activity
MKGIKFLLMLSIVGLCTVSQAASALTPAQLGLQRGASLSLTGAVQTVYAIQYTTNLARPDAWRCLSVLGLPASPYLVPGTAPSATGRRFYRAVAMARTNLNLVFIPPGAFTMGSPVTEVGRSSDEGPQATVTNSLGFWMGIYPVTQQEYLLVMSNNPSYFNGVRSGQNYGIDLARPVEQVTWVDATNYCAVITQRGLASGQIPAGFQYRLPTEAEWEYACRAGTTNRFYYGDDPGYTSLTNYAWYADNSNDQTQPVGQKLPNPWGLYDMGGNVNEWCQDWYAASYSWVSGQTDPQGPVTGTARVLRGGASWADSARWVRSASRIGDDPTYPYYCYGFRVVLAPIRP